MPDQKPTRTKQDNAKPQAQQSLSPAGSKVVRPDPLDNLQSPNPEQGKKPETTQDAAAGQHNQGVGKTFSRIEVTNIVLSLIFSFAIVIFTAFSTYYSSKQWEGLQQSLADARETREIENRAYVLVKSIEAREPIRFGVVNEGLVSYVNTGQTPARNVSFRSIAKFTTTPLPNPPPFEDINEEKASSLIVAPPGLDMRGTTNAFRVDNEQYARDISEGRAKMYIYGVIKYTDIFNKTHETQFCGVYIPGTIEFRICPFFNNAN